MPTVLANARAAADTTAIQPHIVATQHVAVGVFAHIPCVARCQYITLIFVLALVIVFVFVQRA
jgi:hypothetical protein